MTQIPEARLLPKEVCPETFLMLMHFLKLYQTEKVMEGIFKICEVSVRKWVWIY